MPLPVKTKQELESLTIPDIKNLLRDSGAGFGGFTRKGDLINHYLSILAGGPTHPRTPRSPRGTSPAAAAAAAAPVEPKGFLVAKTRDELKSLRVVDIKALIKASGNKVNYKLRKDELIEHYLALLQEQAKLDPVKINNKLKELTIPEIKNLMNTGRVQYSSRDRKDDLINTFVKALSPRI